MARYSLFVLKVPLNTNQPTYILVACIGPLGLVWVGFPKPGSFCKTGFSILGKAKTGFRFRFWKSHNCVHCESAGEG